MSKPTNAAENIGKVAAIVGLIVFAVVAVFGIWLLVAWLGIWLLSVLTSGAVVLSIWQGVAGVALLTLIGGFFTSFRS